MLYRVVRNVTLTRLATPLLNTIKQHATMCNKCCMMFYEMLYSFGLGLEEFLRRNDLTDLGETFRGICIIETVYEKTIIFENH